jgi:Protein of unknown function (DUF3489)
MGFNLVPTDVIASGFRYFPKEFAISAARSNSETRTSISSNSKMGWQRHTVRGFMAGAMKKAGYAVESFKPEGGERTYRINA